MSEHFSNFFSYEWNRPTEDIHEAGEQVGMRGVVELLDVDGAVLDYWSVIPQT